MTVEIEYRNVNAERVRLSQLQMSGQIEDNRGIPITELTRRIEGSRFIVEVETTLPSKAVDNMLFDIEDYLNAEAEHVETREIE